MSGTDEPMTLPINPVSFTKKSYCPPTPRRSFKTVLLSGTLWSKSRKPAMPSLPAKSKLPFPWSCPGRSSWPLFGHSSKITLWWGECVPILRSMTKVTAKHYKHSEHQTFQTISMLSSVTLTIIISRFTTLRLSSKVSSSHLER